MRTQSIDPKISGVFKNIDQNASEVIVHELYHIKTLTGAANGATNIPSELSFFQIKTGQNDDNGVPTTYEELNMEVAGQIGTPYKFWGQYLQAFVLPSKASNVPAYGIAVKTTPELYFANNAMRLLSRGVVTINILNQPLIRVAPISGIPAGMGVMTNAVSGFDSVINSEMAVNGVAAGSNKYPIDLYLENQLSFDFKVSFPGGVFPLYCDLRLGFKISGFLVRPRQGGGR